MPTIAVKKNFTLKSHGPKSFHKIAHFPWGYLTKFPMVSYKMLGLFVFRFPISAFAPRWRLRAGSCFLNFCF